MNSNIISISKISDPEEMLKININTIFVFNCIGKRNHESDYIENQIKKSKIINVMFNINETFIIRTLNTKFIIIYYLFPNEMFLIETKESINNSIFYIDNYLNIFYNNNKLEIINMKENKSCLIKTNTALIEDLVSLNLQIYNDNDIMDNIFDINILEPFLLFDQDKYENKIILCEKSEIIKNNMFYVNKIVSIFKIYDNDSFCVLKKQKNKYNFRYILNINNKYIIFNNILEIVCYINENCFDIIKKTCFVFDNK